MTDEDRPPDWMTFLTKHCGLYIPGVYVSNPYNDSRPLTAVVTGWKQDGTATPFHRYPHRGRGWKAEL